MGAIIVKQFDLENMRGVFSERMFSRLVWFTLSKENRLSYPLVFRHDRMRTESGRK